MGGTAALGLQAFGLGSSAAGSYYNAKGQKSALTAQAKINENNAKLAEMSAQSALLAGQRQEQAIRLNTAQIKSSQKAAQAANGIDLGSTSAVAVRTTTDLMGELDAATAAANAMRQAFGYRSQAQEQRNSALISNTTSSSINPFTSAATSLIGGAGQVASSWYSMNKAGVFSTDIGQTLPWRNEGVAGSLFGLSKLSSNALY